MHYSSNALKLINDQCNHMYNLLFKKTFSQALTKEALYLLWGLYMINVTVATTNYHSGSILLKKKTKQSATYTQKTIFLVSFQFFPIFFKKLPYMKASKGNVKQHYYYILWTQFQSPFSYFHLYISQQHGFNPPKNLLLLDMALDIWTIFYSIGSKLSALNSVILQCIWLKIFGRSCTASTELYNI